MLCQSTIKLLIISSNITLTLSNAGLCRIYIFIWCWALSENWFYLVSINMKSIAKLWLCYNQIAHLKLPSYKWQSRHTSKLKSWSFVFHYILCIATFLKTMDCRKDLNCWRFFCLGWRWRNIWNKMDLLLNILLCHEWHKYTNDANKNY